MDVNKWRWLTGRVIWTKKRINTLGPYGKSQGILIKKKDGDLKKNEQEEA